MKKIEDVVNNVLSGDAQKNALDLIAHIRAGDESEKFPIVMHDEKDESGWNTSNLGFIIVTGSDEFPGPWAMWLGAENIGEQTDLPVDQCVKEFAWANVSPCGSCGGTCSPGLNTKIFGKAFENTCQANLMFVNPDAEAVKGMKKIIDIRKNEVIKNG